MINILLSGVGGQGTVLAAKILAQAAQEKGWHVRTAETIGMAQRGGSVVSHVRMGDGGEEVASSLIPAASADLVVAFEPAEGARVLPFLKPGGMLVTASTPVQSVLSTLSKAPYDAQEVLGSLAGMVERLCVVDDDAVCKAVGSRKPLNMILLARALNACGIGITIEDLKRAVEACVKERYIEANLIAIDAALSMR